MRAAERALEYVRVEALWLAALFTFDMAAHRTRRPRMEKLDCITQRHEVMGGKACIRGIRVTVGMIVGQIGAGRSVDELLADYPYLERDLSLHW